MDYTPEISKETIVIQSYGIGCFSIRGETYNTPITIINNKVSAWGVTDLAQTSFEDYKAILDLEQTPEILLIGTGKTMQRLPMRVQKYFIEKGIGLEVIATPAGCRTFNILQSEGRHVCAMLLPI